MRKLIIFATAYPYAAAILAVIWIGGAILLAISDSLSLNTVLLVNSSLTFVIAAIGFKK